MSTRDDTDSAEGFPSESVDAALTPLEQQLEEDILFERNYYIQLAIAKAVAAFNKAYFEDAGFDDNVKLQVTATRVYYDDEKGEVPGVIYEYKEEL